MKAVPIQGLNHSFIRLCAFVAPNNFLFHPQQNVFRSATQKRSYVSQTLMEVDLDSYLASISNRIDNLNSNVYTKIRLPNRKPMIRTLLGIDDGVAFDLLIRTVKKEEEYYRVANFVQTHLVPWLEGHPKTLDKAPTLPLLINQALNQSPAKGSSVFQRLGAGPKYKGKAEDMIRDLAPSLISSYEQANSPLTEEEIMMTIIKERISKYDTNEKEVPIEQLIAAIRCLNFFQGNSIDDRDSSNCDNEDCISDSDFSDIQNDESRNPSQNSRVMNSKQTGLHCERSLMNFLESRLRSDQFGPPDEVLLLQNVFINYKATSARRKYTDASSNWSSVSIDENTGIIWSSNGRDGMCSEFDAVVMRKIESPNDSTTHLSCDGPLQRTTIGEVSLTEIWEAKHTLSPSTLFDAIAKKGKSICSLYADPDASLWRDIRSSSKRFIIKKRLEGGTEPSLLFGIYGKEMLDPSSALDLLRVMAVSKVLSSDVKAIAKSLDTGYVSVTPSELKYGLNQLEAVLINLRNQGIQIRIVVETN